MACSNNVSLAPFPRYYQCFGEYVNCLWSSEVLSAKNTLRIPLKQNAPEPRNFSATLRFVTFSDVRGEHLNGFLPTALAGKVEQTIASVCPSVSTLSFEPTNL